MTMFSESLRAFLKPVVGLLDDNDVSEILINGPKEIWVERRGRLSRTEVTFTEDGLLAAARNMAQYVGRPLNDEHPRLDARLPDGSRIHVVLGPVARRGTTVSIRKFFRERLTVQKLIELGTVTPRVARLIEALVGLRLNIIVSGGTGSGKTSLLNVLSSFIAPEERILTIEDSAELQLQQPHLVSFESRPADRLGKGEVDIGHLLHSALRLRPDRIIVGEVRGGECFYLLQAMNTGHGGTLTTAHANTPVDTLRRLESLCLLSGVDMPLRAVRAQVASAAHLVVCCARFSDGTRKITHISEVLPLDEKGEYRTQDLLSFTTTAREKDGRVVGHFTGSGVLPTFFARFAATGFTDVDASFFQKRTASEAEPAPSPMLLPPDAEPRSEAAAKPLRIGPVAPKPVAEPPREPPRAAAVSPEPRPVAKPLVATKPRPPPEGPEPLRPAPAVARAQVATPRPPLARKPPPVIGAESSIELEPDLQAEVERRLPNESTLITRNPLHDARPLDEDTQPGTRRR
jgi:pilus assembly protein CpaF